MPKKQLLTKKPKEKAFEVFRNDRCQPSTVDKSLVVKLFLTNKKSGIKLPWDLELKEV